MTATTDDGLALHPFVGLRPAVDGDQLARLLCPPYDVIDAETRAALLAADSDNAVAVVLPQPTEPCGDAYVQAAQRLDRWVAVGSYRRDPAPALYVYEMSEPTGSTTRGLIGAVELRDPRDGVILPHEDTMAGPVSDRLALMSATEANLEPIYLVYDGGGMASELVRDADRFPLLACTTTRDGVTHRLWAVTDPAVLAGVAADLAGRRALIADGHHRYATYRELQRRLDAERGAGAWDRGLTLLVDTSSYGPRVHAIHRVLVATPLATVVEQARSWCEVVDVATPAVGLDRAKALTGFAVVLTDGERVVVLHDAAGRLAAAAGRAGEPPVLATLDVTVLHRTLVEQVWRLRDTADVVGYAHSAYEAISVARSSGGTAVLLRATPVGAVAEVAAAGARMPRKSTLFTPKPASGLVMRRFVDES
jgi:uncharacterized protein (DUF1015 family)